VLSSRPYRQKEIETSEIVDWRLRSSFVFSRTKAQIMPIFALMLPEFFC